MNNRRTGSEYEDFAISCLQSKGYRILERNYHSRYGEIDIIARDQDSCFCFIEVKYRSDNSRGTGFEAVDHRKQVRICRAARAWLAEHGLGEWTPCRFDVLSITSGFDPSEENGIHIRLLINAFDYHTC